MSRALRLYLDRSPGETRGVATANGRSERLLIARTGDSAAQPGAGFIGRVREAGAGQGVAFLDLGGGLEAVLPNAPGAPLRQGQALELEVVAPARRGKTAVVRSLGVGEGEPRLLHPAPDVAARLRTLAPGVDIIEGDRAREAADAAEDEALQGVYALGSGAELSIEKTRGMIAVDVDVGMASGDRRRNEARANRLAVEAAARLLRLQGLGGLVVFDLAGRGGDGESILKLAREAFAADQPGVVFGPVSRLGVLHLALPWRTTPLAEILLDETGRPSAESLARRLARAIEREARGATRVLALCAPPVAERMAALAPELAARLGPRFDIQAEPGRAMENLDVRPAA